MLIAESQPTRQVLVAEMRDRLTRESFPRAIILCLLIVSGSAAFLSSFIALQMGLDSMALRYGLATLVGYGAFIALIRTWIAIRRGWSADCLVDLIPWENVPVDRAPGSGGSGATDEGVSGVADRLASSLTDFDDFWWLVLAGVALCAGLVAIGAIVYSAPLLLAEVALDAALVSTVYSRLRRDEAGHWATTTIRQTWTSALTLIVFMAAVGFALQRLAPDAHSIGGVVRQLTS